jgi:sodium/potassium-transporting ATPase subunit alpha
MGTELMPAISLVYERPESDIMKRNPRKAKDDRLISL